MSINCSQKSYYQQLDDFKLTKYWNRDRYSTLTKLLEDCKVGPGLSGQDASFIMFRCVLESNSKDEAKRKVDKVIDELRELANHLQSTPMVGVMNKEQKPYQSKKKQTKDQRTATEKVCASLQIFWGTQNPVQSSESAVTSDNSLAAANPNSNHTPPTDEMDAYINYGNDNGMNETDEGFSFAPQEPLDPNLIALLETDGVSYAQTPQGVQEKFTVTGNQWIYSIKYPKK